MLVVLRVMLSIILQYRDYFRSQVASKAIPNRKRDARKKLQHRSTKFPAIDILIAPLLIA